jgi:hypothetical protein
MSHAKTPAGLGVDEKPLGSRWPQVRTVQATPPSNAWAA